MKKTLLLLTVGLLAPRVFGGSEQIIKERAKELSNQNNVRQGVAPPTQPNQQNPAAAAPTPPSIETQNLNRFSGILGTIKADEAVTEDKKQQMTTYLLGAAQDTKPPAASVRKFVDALSASASQKPLPADKRARLVQEIDAVMNPSKYPQAKMPAIYSDLQAIFQVNGADRKDAVNLVDNIKALSPSAQTTATK
jgi:hypothetical protein